MVGRLGATILEDDRCCFLVWAPFCKKVEVHLAAPQERLLPLQKADRGYHRAVVEGVELGSLYFYRMDGNKERPDPASRSQPQGVHGPSQVVADTFKWDDLHWHGLPLPAYIIYELHVGTFTPDGTFEAIIPHLEGLKKLGITAVELMPVAQFPGKRNWGYDGVYPSAAQSSYGGPDGLKTLVNACHREGLAVVLDVVYNHFGPEGNYLADFGPYFTDHYRTPWGKAINFDGPHSDEVRHYFVENALGWVTDFHIDALRLDALHAILDTSALPFLTELAASVHRQVRKLNRHIYLIGESNLNDIRLLRPAESGGHGLDGQWNDDFHHCLHVLLTGEQSGYYQDFGSMSQMVKAYREGFVFSGEYSPCRLRRHGSSSASIPAQQFVIFAQNHDQVGNRMLGERLSQLVSLERLKLAAGTVILSPFLPLLFMGEEYGETAPFLYFIDHSDKALIETVRRGRREEFAAFSWQGEPPDPQDEMTFQRAKINHGLKEEKHHHVMLEFYETLLRLRKNNPALNFLSKDNLEVSGDEKTRLLFLRRWNGDEQAVLIFNFSGAEASAVLTVPAGIWHKELDSADRLWLGEGSTVPEKLKSQGELNLRLRKWSFVLLIKEN